LKKEKMKLKDKDGLYENWVPIAIIIATIIYTLTVILVIFPWIDRLNK